MLRCLVSQRSTPLCEVGLTSNDDADDDPKESQRTAEDLYH